VKRRVGAFSVPPPPVSRDLSDDILCVTILNLIVVKLISSSGARFHRANSAKFIGFGPGMSALPPKADIKRL
jgi:hypothetical protein